MQYGRCDGVLKLGKIGKLSVEAVGPDMGRGTGLDELRIGLHLHPIFPDAAFQQVANPKFSTDLPRVDRLSLIGEGRTR